MNDLVAYFNAFAESWLIAIGRAAWQGGVALLLALAISRFVPGLSARVKCWIWRLAYLKVLIAFLWSQPVELPILAPAAPPRVAQPLAEPATYHIAPQADNAVSRRVSPSLPLCLLAIWLAGIAAGGALIGGDLIRLQILKRRCVAVKDPGLYDCVAELSRRLRLTRIPRLLTCNEVSTPFVFGLWRPRIVLPSRLLDNPDTAALRLMLAHEMAHVKRRDLCWAWLLSVTEALFFFHPLVWLARREARLVQEMACDDLAVRATSVEAAQYGRMLLNVIAHGHSRRLTSVSVGIFETKQSLERRIRHMKTIRPGRIGVMISGLLLCACVAVTVPWRVVAQKASAPAISAEESNPAELDLLRKEVDLARRIAQAEEKLLESGRTTPQVLLERQREFVLLQQELARQQADPAAQEQVLRDALAQTKRLLREQKARVELGTLPPQSELGFEREVVRLERELRALSRSIAPRSDAERNAKETGTSRQVQVSSPVAGIITKVSVQPGAKVKKGDVLLEFDNREARVKVDAAQSQVAAAEAALKLEEIEVEDVQIEYNRQKEHHREKLMGPPSETRGPKAAEARLNKRRADLRFTKAQLDLAGLGLESLAVRAPRDGTVSAIRVSEGEYVSAGGRPLIVLDP